MPQYRRSFIQGGTFFFTVVTHDRLRILTSRLARPLLRSAWMQVGRRLPFETVALCLLPDHLHCIWQRRFWKHTIRDEVDLNRHLDYIHYNPVKHRLVKRVAEWPWSSFHRYVKMGFYEAGWRDGIEARVEDIRCAE
jgi:putative transposase